MACNRWENEGLLLTSGELSATESKTFEEHMGVCAECHQEFHSYQEMKSQFFTPGLMQYAIPETLDIFAKEKEPQENARIIWGMPMFSFIRYRVAPVLILVIGVVIGYSVLPGSESGQASSTNTNQTSAVAQRDSVEEKEEDTLREFREGGSTGIKSVDVSE